MKLPIAIVLVMGIVVGTMFAFAFSIAKQDADNYRNRPYRTFLIQGETVSCRDVEGYACGLSIYNCTNSKKYSCANNVVELPR